MLGHRALCNELWVDCRLTVGVMEGAYFSFFLEISRSWLILPPKMVRGNVRASPGSTLWRTAIFGDVVACIPAKTPMAESRRFLKVECKKVFCTKIASKLVRTYTEKHGLKDLCKELLDVDLNKSQQSTDWSSETLSESQRKRNIKSINKSIINPCKND